MEHFGCRVACDGKVVVIVTIVNVSAMMHRVSSVSWPGVVGVSVSGCIQEA